MNPAIAGRLLIEDLGDEVLAIAWPRTSSAASSRARSVVPRRDRRCHLHDCGPALALLMKHREAASEIWTPKFARRPRSPVREKYRSLCADLTQLAGSRSGAAVAGGQSGRPATSWTVSAGQRSTKFGHVDS